MIVCVCRNINDREVKSAVDRGAKRPRDVQAFHGCEFDCGTCKPAIKAIIAEHRAAATRRKTSTILNAAKDVLNPTDTPLRA